MAVLQLKVGQFKQFFGSTKKQRIALVSLVAYNYKQNKMTNTQRVELLTQQYQQIINKKCPSKVKKLMLEGLVSQLRELDKQVKPPMELQINSFIKQDKTVTAITSASILTIGSTLLEKSSNYQPSVDISNMRQQTLLDSILEKQRMKCILNEQIENHEDDLYQLQKILLTKKDYEEELEHKIARLSYDIGKLSVQKSAREGEKKNFSTRIRHFFHM